MLTALERAFELARSGKFQTIPRLREQLAREGFARQTLVGPTLPRQLRRLMEESRVTTPDPEE